MQLKVPLMIVTATLASACVPQVDNDTSVAPADTVNAAPADGYGEPLATATSAAESGSAPAEPPLPVPVVASSATEAAAEPDATSSTVEPTFSVPASGGDSEVSTSVPDSAVVAVEDVDGTTILVEGNDVDIDAERSVDTDPVPAEGYAISSNLADGVEYPLSEMVDLAVDVLVAETTGAGRERFQHLADQVTVCCSDVEVVGAVVLFGAATSDPATIIVEWRAASAFDGQPVAASTRSLWWFRDGDWLGEFEMSDS